MTLLDRITFVIGETFIALRRNLSMGFAAITTTAISLFLLAGMFYVGSRTAEYLNSLPGRFEMKVNLKEGTSFESIKSSATAIRAMPGVKDVTWLPRKNQWEKFKKEHPDLTAGYGFDDNIFPDSFRVRLSDLGKSDAVAKALKALPAFDPEGGLNYFGEAQKTASQWLRVAQNLSLLIGGLLLGVSGILIFNAIRMTVESRRVEVSIMRLVGASRIVVSLPFALEGLLHGAIGGALATSGLYAVQRVVELRLAEFSVDAALAPFPVSPYLGALCAIGGGYGGLCALFAMGRPLRARSR